MKYVEGFSMYYRSKLNKKINKSCPKRYNGNVINIGEIVFGTT